MTEHAIKPAFKWQWLALAALVVTYFTLAYMIPPGADTLWRLHIARGILDGQTLYRDVIEVNPPLWFWAAIPAASLGGYAALVAINLVATLTGLAIFGALARLMLDVKGQWAAILGLAAGLLLVNVAEIGQREQAFLLACALWSGLAAARIEGKTVPIWLALLATCFAAYGFALKHYFVLVPVAIEAFVIWHKRRTWKPFRPETLLLAGLAGLYALAVIYLTPDYLGRVLGLVQASYFGFGPSNVVSSSEFQNRIVKISAFILGPVIALVITRDNRPLICALLLALLISIATIILQEKYWRYHYIAGTGLSIVIVAMTLQLVFAYKPRFISQGILLLTMAGIIWLGFVQPLTSNLKSDGQPINFELKNIVNQEPLHNHIVILSIAPERAFLPLAREKRSHWSRHYSMWMMPGLLTPQSDLIKQALKNKERDYVRDEFTQDIMCTPPDLIVGEVGYLRNSSRTLFNAMLFLRSNTVFDKWLDSAYVQKPDISRYPIWRLKGAKPAPQNCAKPR